MTNQLFAEYSNLMIYSAMAVLTLAMIAFAVDLARTLPALPSVVTASTSDTATRADPPQTPSRSSALVGAPGLPGQPTAEASPSNSRPITTGRGATAASPVAAPAAPKPTTPLTNPASAIPGAARRAAGIAMSLTWLGGILALAGILLRGLSVSRVPWGNMYEFATTGAAAVLAAYLLLSLRRDVRWLGIFVVGPSLLTLGLAVTVYYTQASQLLPALRSVWLIIHVSVAIVSIAVFTLAFSITIIYLLQAQRETKREARLTTQRQGQTVAPPETRRTVGDLAVAAVDPVQPLPPVPAGSARTEPITTTAVQQPLQTPVPTAPGAQMGPQSFPRTSPRKGLRRSWVRGSRQPASTSSAPAVSRASFMDVLPDAASLERTSYALHIVAFPLWTFTLIAGAIWAEQAWGAYWQWDPKEVWTFIIWVVYAAYLHARATGGWKRQRAALIACAGYACILVNYMVVNVYFVGMHSYSGM